MRIQRYLALGLAWLSLAPWALSQNVSSINKVPDRIERTAHQLTHALRRQGFDVTRRGYFRLWGSVESCAFTVAQLGRCFGPNPAAPYVTFTVPAWPGEFVDSNSNMFAPSPAGYHDVIRFDPREAIVILAQMPPPARYFSVQSFIWSRQGTYDTNSTTYKDIAADPDLNFLLPVLFRTVNALHPERVLVWASLSNPINNVVMQGRSGVPFNRLRYFIITPDDVMNRAIRDAFADISVEDNDIFTEHIPSNMNFGLDEAADDFDTLIRYAQPDDGGAVGTPSDTWRKNLPMVVLRVRDVSNRAPQPYPPEVLERRTAFNEYKLQSDLFSLVSAVHRRWTGQPCADADCSDVAHSFRDLQMAPISLVGPLCLPIGENCLGDNQDTTYQVNFPISLDHGEIYAVAGTLGTETGNATYVGFGLNQMPLMIGVKNLSDGDLKGTATAYAGQVKHTGKFFLYYFTRDCSGLEDLTDNHCLEIDETMVPSGDQVVFSIRDYVRPGTERGPDSSKVLPPMLMPVQRP